MVFADLGVNSPQLGDGCHGVSAQESPDRAKKLTEDPATVDQGEEDTDSENKKKQHGRRKRTGDQDDPGGNQSKKKDVLEPDVPHSFRPVFLKTDEAMMQSLEGSLNISDCCQ